MQEKILYAEHKGSKRAKVSSPSNTPRSFLSYANNLCEGISEFEYIFEKLKRKLENKSF